MKKLQIILPTTPVKPKDGAPGVDARRAQSVVSMTKNIYECQKCKQQRIVAIAPSSLVCGSCKGPMINRGMA